MKESIKEIYDAFDFISIESSDKKLTGKEVKELIIENEKHNLYVNIFEKMKQGKLGRKIGSKIIFDKHGLNKIIKYHKNKIVEKK